MHLQVSDWNRLGLALDLESYDLDIIGKDHRGDTRTQTLKMFQLWLKKQPDASYEQLIKALNEVGDERSVISSFVLSSCLHSSPDSNYKVFSFSISASTYLDELSCVQDPDHRFALQDHTFTMSLTIIYNGSLMPSHPHKLIPQVHVVHFP